MSVTYLKAGDYRIPALEIPDSKPLDRFARLRKTYLQENLPNEYTAMMITGRLIPHLNELGQQAETMFEQLMKDLEQKKPAPNKAVNATAWTAHMTKLRKAAEEEVLTTLVYVQTT